MFSCRLARGDMGKHTETNKGISKKQPIGKPASLRSEAVRGKNLVGKKAPSSTSRADPRNKTTWEEPFQGAPRAERPGLFVEQQVTPLFFGRTRPATGNHQQFGDERHFWEQCEKLPLKTVQLKGLRVCDWLPRAPGVFWSHDGIYAREYSFRHHHITNDPELGLIVNPQAKMSLIEEGGLGTIRLRPRRI